MTSRPCGCAVVGDAQLVLERSRLLQVPLPLWCSGCGQAKLGVRERGVERHAEPLGCGQAGPPGRPGPSRPAGEVQESPCRSWSRGLPMGKIRAKVCSAAQAWRAACLVAGERSPAAIRSRWTSATPV